MVYKKFGRVYVVRLDEGEEILEKVKLFCAAAGIKLASVNGIGAVSRANIGIYKLREKRYQMRELVGDYEITNISGNISTMNGEVYLHFHINLSDDEQRTWGGHLNAAYVGGTCELIIEPIDGEIERSFDDKVGLNLLQL